MIAGSRWCIGGGDKMKETTEKVKQIVSEQLGVDEGEVSDGNGDSFAFKPVEGEELFQVDVGDTRLLDELAVH